jgi:hypothetical protein
MVSVAVDSTVPDGSPENLRNSIERDPKRLPGKSYHA